MRFLPGLIRLAFTAIFWVALQSILLPQEESIAVLDLEGRGISQPEAISLSDRLRAALVRTDKVRIIERGQMEAVLREQDFSLTGCTSNECAVEVGELLGVTHMVAGTIGKVGSMFTIDLRVVSVASGEIVRSISKDYQGEIEGLVGLMTVIADQFVGLSSPQGPITQEISIPNGLSNNDLSSEKFDSLNTVDEIYDLISNEELHSLSIGDSVYICDYGFLKYSWHAGLIINKRNKHKYSIRVDQDGDAIHKLSNRLIKKYAWLDPYWRGFEGKSLEIGDKVIAVSFEAGIVKGIVIKKGWLYNVTLETNRIGSGTEKKSTHLVDLRSIAMIRVPVE